MRKILYILFIIGGMIMISSCTIKNNITYDIKYYGAESITDSNAFYYKDKSYEEIVKCSPTAKLIKSQEALFNLCSNYNSPAFDQNSNKYDYEVNKFLRSFDKEYFDDKALIIGFGTGRSGGILGDVENILIENECLIVNYSRSDSDAIIQIVENVPWILIIEIDNKNLENIEEVKLIKK